MTVELNWPIGDVDVWRVPLDCAQSDFLALEAALSGEERVRSSMLKTEELRRRWTIARGALRTILSGYVGAVPNSLIITTDVNRKPKLVKIDRAPSFSLSQTAHLAFVAVARGRRVGIDAEILRPEIEWVEIGRQFFSRAEANEIGSLAPEIRTAAFFACWTRKEAYLKALGIGLFGALHKFQVAVHPDGPASLLWVEGSPDEPRQ